MRCEIKSHDVRTADNVLVLCRSELKVEAALETIRDWIEQGGLTLYPAKAKIVDCHAESLATKKAQLVELTPRKRSGSIESIAWELNPISIDRLVYLLSSRPLESLQRPRRKGTRSATADADAPSEKSRASSTSVALGKQRLCESGAQESAGCTLLFRTFPSGKRLTEEPVPKRSRHVLERRESPSLFSTPIRGSSALTTHRAVVLSSSHRFLPVFAEHRYGDMGAALRGMWDWDM